MTVGERIAIIREQLQLNQETFGKKINVTRSAVSNYEKGTRNIMDRVISDICREYNVNQEWLRNGTGEMFIEPDTFSLDEYVRQRGMTEEELDIIKGIFEIPEEFRRQAIEYFKTKILPKIRFSNDNDLAATKEESIEKNIDSEVEAYRQELIAESKGETLSVSEMLNVKEGA